MKIITLNLTEQEASVLYCMIDSFTGKLGDHNGYRYAPSHVINHAFDAYEKSENIKASILLELNKQLR